MILQVFVGPAAAAAGLVGGAAALPTQALGFGLLAPIIQQLAGIVLGQGVQTGFQPRSPKISRRELGEVLFNVTRTAISRGEALQTATDPFTGGLVTFTSSQAPIATELVEQAARRRFAARLPTLERRVFPDFSPALVADIQRLFQQVPPAIETGRLPPRVARVRRQGLQFGLSSGIQRRAGPRFLSQRSEV